MRSILQTKNKKGQLSLQDAPTIVLLVGLTFLVMATIALIASRYGEAIPSDTPRTITEETLITVTETGERVNGASANNFERFAIVTARNTTGVIINSNNYTITTDGLVKASSAGYFNNTNWIVNYTYYYSGGSATNVTNSLQTEINNNTSIAGIVLTISLVGIVLTVLIGIFMVTRRGGRA